MGGGLSAEELEFAYVLGFSVELCCVLIRHTQSLAVARFSTTINNRSVNGFPNFMMLPRIPMPLLAGASKMILLTNTAEQRRYLKSPSRYHSHS